LSFSYPAPYTEAFVVYSPFSALSLMSALLADGNSQQHFSRVTGSVVFLWKPEISTYCGATWRLKLIGSPHPLSPDSLELFFFRNLWPSPLWACCWIKPTLIWLTSCLCCTVLKNHLTSRTFRSFWMIVDP